MGYEIFFTLISAILFLFTFLFIQSLTGWSLFATWLVAINLVTLVIYCIDKGSAEYLKDKSKTIRVPEFVLNLLAVAGGFAGGWAGMIFCRHKIHPTKDPMIWIILALSTLIYGLLIYELIVRPNTG